jgi:hypothetical protein
MLRWKRPVVGPLTVLRVSFYGEVTADCPAAPKSSARYDLAVVVSRPVSIFLRVLTGFFLFGFSLFQSIFRNQAERTSWMQMGEAPAS